MIHDWKKTKRYEMIKFRMYFATHPRFKLLREMMRDLRPKNEK